MALEPPPLHVKPLDSNGITFGAWREYWNALKNYLDKRHGVIQSQTISGTPAMVDFSNKLVPEYGIYELYLDDVVLTNDAENLYIRVGTGTTPTYQASGYQWSILGRESDESAVDDSGSTSDSEIQLTDSVTNLDNLGSDTNESLSGKITIYSSQAASYTKIVWELSYMSNTGNIAIVVGSGVYQATTVVTSLRLVPSASTLESGTITLRGRDYTK